MHAVRRRLPGRACEEACSLASLALDEPLDELARRLLRRHLDGCAECAEVVGEMTAVVAMIRAAPLEPFGSDAPAEARRPRRRASWVPGVAAMAAVAATVVSLAHASTAPSPLRPVVAAVDVSTWSAGPVRLPIGQRSAASDFAAGPHLLRA